MKEEEGWMEGVVRNEGRQREGDGGKWWEREEWQRERKGKEGRGQDGETGGREGQGNSHIM